MSDKVDLPPMGSWVWVSDPDHSRDDTEFVKTYFGQNCPVLTWEMNGFRGIGDYSLRRLPGKISRLNLTDCRGVALKELPLPDTLEYVWLANMPLLTHFTPLPAALRFLDLSKTGVRDPSFSSLPNLQHLVLDETGTDGTCFDTLPQGLQWLSLKGCSITKWNGLKSAVVWLDVRGCDLCKATDHFKTMDSLRHLLISQPLDTSLRPEKLQSLGRYRWDDWSVPVCLECYGKDRTYYSEKQLHPELDALVRVIDAGGGGLFFDGVIPPELRPHIGDWFVDNLPDTVERLDLSECNVRWPSLNHWPTGLRILKAPARMTPDALKKLPNGLEDLTLHVDTLDAEMLEALPQGLKRFEFTSDEGPPRKAFDPLVKREATLIPKNCPWWTDD